MIQKLIGIKFKNLERLHFFELLVKKIKKKKIKSKNIIFRLLYFDFRLLGEFFCLEKFISNKEEFNVKNRA